MIVSCIYLNIHHTEKCYIRTAYTLIRRVVIAQSPRVVTGGIRIVPP
jgi:hypothetical protein